MGVGFGYIVTCVVQEFVFPHSSVTVHVIVDMPTLNVPLASTPDPLRVVAPDIAYVMVKPAAGLQLSFATSDGIV